MQVQFSRGNNNDGRPGAMEEGEEEIELRRFIGIEYVVAQSSPPSLFIIHKRDRTSPTEAKTIAVYYVLNDNIYQSPSLYSVINERLLTSLHALSSSLNLLKSKKPVWSPENLYNWDIKPPPTSSIQALDASNSSLPSGNELIPEASGTIEEIEGETEETVGGNNKRVREVEMNDDEDTTRPSTTFNPLLWSALQSVALSTSINQHPQNNNNSNGGGNLPLPPIDIDIKEVVDAVEIGNKEKENVIVKDKVESNGVIRIGPTGKRKPKKAA